MSKLRLLKNIRIMTVCMIVFIGFSFAPENKNYPDTLSFTQNTFSSFDLQFQNIIPEGINEITLPLKTAGRLLMLEATIDNVKGNLIFDSGATELVLNRTYFRDHARTGIRNSHGITGSVNGVERIHIDKLSIGPLNYEKLSASMADLGHIENQRGVKVLGLMNFKLIKDFEIVIDVSKNELQIYRINKSGERISSSSQKQKYDCSQDVTIFDDIIFLRANINGKQLKFCLDTGAEISVLDIDVPKKILNSISIERKIDLSGTGTLKKEVLYGKLKELNIDGHKIKNMQVIITGMDALSEAYGTPVDGILGYNFLSEGIFCINFVKKQLQIQYKNRERE